MPSVGEIYKYLPQGEDREVRDDKMSQLEVLAVRPSSSSSSSTTADAYFVHFLGTDKRLDKWVSPDCIGEWVQRKIAPSNSHKRGASSAPRLSGGADGSSGGGRAGADVDGSGGHGHDGHSAHGAHSPARSVHAHGHHDPKTKVRNVERVQFGKYVIDTWYYSPYPSPYGDMVETLCICEFTFKYMLGAKTLAKYHRALELRRPPGRQIYDDPNRKIAVFEMVGREHRVYCQNLCLFAKLFIEHKTLYYDADPFLFYVLTEYDADGSHHPVGYYSKEIHSAEDYNLACILTFPPFQRNGYGRFLMSLSYEISKRESKLGSPEKPLSDLGKLSYRSYWQFVLLSYLSTLDVDLKTMSLDHMCASTAIKPEDAISTLQHMCMVQQWKGQLTLFFTRAEVQERLAKYTKRAYGSKVCLNEYLTWTLPEGGFALKEKVVGEAAVEAAAAADGEGGSKEGAGKENGGRKEPPLKRLKL
jgi:histone acetyltransferase MYST1